MIRYVSLFSGIEAASVAWESLGWQPVAFSEIEPFPNAVLAYRFPDVPNLGDITKVDWHEVKEKYGAVDLIVGGSPCQSFSVAGTRTGLDGESGLMFEYIRAIRDVRPTWFLWENVPGVFSIDQGRAFATLLCAMDELGYGMAWRVLDAQFFGVAQRRKRVFLVGYIGNAAYPAAVLFNAESVSGNTQSSSEKRENLTTCNGSNPRAYCLQGRARLAGHDNGSNYGDDVSYTLTATESHGVCYALGGFADYQESDATSTLKASGGGGMESLLIQTAEIM